jgi:general nucleoside transport system ATP-binding protein
MTEPTRAFGLETLGMSKVFGPLVALEDVSITIAPGEFHALLGENGAGKSTLVKCIMGFYQPTRGQLRVNGQETIIRNPGDARAAGIGMVYQHFTLVPSLTVAENLVISRADTPAVIPWRKELAALDAFMARMPFRVPLKAQVGSLSAGERQKLEILKQLYLDQHFLILDEPTSVLTPGEADEVLGLLGAMAARKDITVLMITHKFREVNAFADTVSVLRRGRFAGGGAVADLTTEDMSRMMIGDTAVRTRATRKPDVQSDIKLELEGLFVDDDEGLPAVEAVSLRIKGGEILGIAGVSGNGQTELVEAISGQRPLTSGRVFINGQPFEARRADFDQFKVFGLPEEPLRNAAVRRMSVAENIAFRTFDKPPMASLGWWMSPAKIKDNGRELIARYRVKTPSPDTPIENLSGGNVQRTVLARELSGDVKVLIAANPCFGLDFASVAEIRAQIIEQRNRGAAVLLVSEDLDEILELADRVAVMSEGRIAYVAPIAGTDRNTIGRHMAGHGVESTDEPGNRDQALTRSVSVDMETPNGA